MSEKTKAVVEQLKAGVQEIFTSGRYAEYLRFLSRFRSYSARNRVLIACQCPEATLVASYTDWQTKHHRQVKRGEKAIKILAPHTYRKKSKDPDADDEDALGFHVASCFDVGQTYSPKDEPLPEIASRLQASVEDYGRLFADLKAIAPVPVGFEDIPGTANGYYSHTENRIAIKNGLSQLQTVKTCIHEIAHARLHAKGGPEEKADGRTREIQASIQAITDTSDELIAALAGRGWTGTAQAPAAERQQEPSGQPRQPAMDFEPADGSYVA